MIKSFLIASAVIVGLMLAWGLVQGLWRRIFAEHIQEADVLAGRRSCANCGCMGVCERKEDDEKVSSMKFSGGV